MIFFARLVDTRHKSGQGLYGPMGCKTGLTELVLYVFSSKLESVLITLLLNQLQAEIRVNFKTRGHNCFSYICTKQSPLRGKRSTSFDFSYLDLPILPHQCTVPAILTHTVYI
jgi:hypothetical protein